MPTGVFPQVGATPSFATLAGTQNIDQMPSAELTNFGSGGQTFPEEGNIYRLTTAGTNPSSTGSDYVVATFTLPANSFDVAGRGVNVLSQGSVANNTNAKRIKLYFGCTTATIGSVVTGGTVIADTGSYTTTGAAGWSLEANVFKYGNTGSNTQEALHMSAQVGGVVGSLLVPTALTATESSPILIAVTANATTATTDIIFNFFEINAMN
jgi:hypothetical protein